MTELCTEFKVSWKTGHKWLRRYQAEGTIGLRDRSRRPHGCAHHTAEYIEQLIVQERRRHRTWGPKKLRRLLRRDHRIKRPPAVSTNRELLANVLEAQCVARSFRAAGRGQVDNVIVESC